MARTGAVSVALALVLGSATSATAATSAATHAFGTRGAHFESGKWERVAISADLGKDQFGLAGHDVFVVVLELDELYQRRGDFVETLDQFLANVSARMQNPAPEPELGFERYEGFSRATRRVRGLHANIDLWYQLDLISAGDGVGYLLLGWTVASQRSVLEAEVDELVESIAWPAEGSAWHAKTVPTAHALAFGDWTVELTYADSIVTPDESQPGTRYSFTADAGDSVIHLFVDELEGDLNEALDAVIEAAWGKMEYDELGRENLELPLGRGRQVVLRSREQPPSDLALAVVALEPGRWLDLRMTTSGPNGHREQLWTALLGSLRATREEPIDAFPVVAAADSPRSSFLSDAAGRLLAGSRLLGTVGWSRAVEVRAGGALVVQDDKEVLEHSPRLPIEAESESPDPVDLEPTVLYAAADHLAGSLFVWGDETLLAEPGEELHWIVSGGLHPAGFRADQLAADGELAVVARSDPQRTLLGLGTLPIVGPSRIVVRRRSGEEREIQQLADRRVVGLALHGGRALVAAEPRERAAGREDASVELSLIDTRDGAARRLESFIEVSRVVGAAEGWLVSGTDGAGDTGVFLLPESGRRERLLAGDLVGLALDRDGLTFVAKQCLQPEEEPVQCVYQAPLALVREHGPGFWPLGQRQVNQVATSTRRRLEEQGLAWSLPSTRHGLAAFVATAQQAAREEVGVELPTGPAGVDLLLSELAYDDQLSPEAIDLLAALLSEALISQGGQWVDAVAGGRNGDPSGLEASNMVAVGVHPLGVVRNTLYGEDGWYRPLESLADLRLGRTLLVGTDRASLQAAVDGAELIELPDLVRRGSTEALLRVLRDRAGNEHLRDQVYRQLAAHGRDRQLLEVARAFATLPEAPAIDRVAFAAARLAGSLTATDAAQLVAMLRDGIERSPGQSELYLLLGAAYEHTALPDRVKYAQACYKKAEATTQWGHVGEASRAALERLAREP